jgi:hypothetical protein
VHEQRAPVQLFRGEGEQGQRGPGLEHEIEAEGGKPARLVRVAVVAL